MEKDLQNKINQLLDLPQRKVNQLINQPNYLRGCFNSLTRYGFELNEVSWFMFFQTISDKLSDNFEYEFSESEFKNLLVLKELPNYKK